MEREQGKKQDKNWDKKKKKLGIFGGTYEGRLLAEFCHREGIHAAVSVATAYGEKLLAGEIRTGRMDAQEMEAWIRQQEITAVVDATHPFARTASEHIRAACKMAQVEYRRLKREEPKARDMCGQADMVWVSSVEEAAAFLNRELLHYPEKKALLTTGSKELACFTAEKAVLARLFVRVLPSVEAIEACREKGLGGKQIIAMQGPFSRELNQAVLHAVGASYLVTKESGQAGGFAEKVEAAQACGCRVIAVRRPEEEGESLERIKQWLESWNSEEGEENLAGRSLTGEGPGECLKEEKKGKDSADKREKEYWAEKAGKMEMEEREITLVGIGTGAAGQITWEGIQALGKADAFLGASRMVESGKELCRQINFCSHGEEGFSIEGIKTGEGLERLWVPVQDKQECVTYKKEEMLSWLEEHPEVKHPAVLFSGDTGFYSGAKGMMELLNNNLSADTVGKMVSSYRIRLLPGISSLSFFAAKIGRSWENVETVSFHGREEKVDWHLSDKRERFFLLDGTAHLHQICQCLIQHGQAQAGVWAGENLSYPTEKIVFGKPEEILQMEFGKLLAAWVIPDGM